MEEVFDEEDSVEVLEKFFFKAIKTLCDARVSSSVGISTEYDIQYNERYEDGGLITVLEDQALLLVEVYERHYNYDWMQETLTMVFPMFKNDLPQRELYTVAHYAVKASFYRLLHDVCIDRYNFDADFYQPRAKLTLLHVVAKYCSKDEWIEHEQE